MKRCRSLIFVPASQPRWLANAHSLGADAVVIDLEDSVPENLKADARSTAREAITALKRRGQRVVIVRTNVPGGKHIDADMREIVVEGLDALMIPMVNGPEDLLRLEPVLSSSEVRAGRAVGSVGLIPIPESALGIYRAFEIARATPRITAMFGGGGRNGDTQRSIGYSWSRDGSETLYLRSKVLLDSRAAGIRQIIGGTWVDVADTEGAAQDARRFRALGYTAYIVIHPGHLSGLNEVFMPTPAEVDAARRTIADMAAAQARGAAAIRLDGAMVNTAMVETARETIALADEFSAPS